MADKSLKKNEIYVLQNMASKIIIDFIFMFMSYAGEKFNFNSFKDTVKAHAKISIENDVGIFFRKCVLNEAIEYIDHFIDCMLVDMPIDAFNKAINVPVQNGPLYKGTKVSIKKDGRLFPLYPWQIIEVESGRLFNNYMTYEDAISASNLFELIIQE